jgi:hypothetical protein
MNTALEYSTRVVQDGGRRCKKSTLNDLVHLTPLRIPLMNPPFVVLYSWYLCNKCYHLTGGKGLKSGWVISRWVGMAIQAFEDFDRRKPKITIHKGTLKLLYVQFFYTIAVAFRFKFFLLSVPLSKCMHNSKAKLYTNRMYSTYCATLVTVVLICFLIVFLDYST